MNTPRFAAACLTGFLLATSAVTSAQVSRNMTLLANVNAHSEYTGVWGYVHPDGREYAVLGTGLGTSILSLAVPNAPVEVAFIPGVNSGSRDIRQYQSYLYVVANFASGGTPGIQIISMADPDHPALANTYTATLGEAEYVNVDPTRALLFTGESDEFTGAGGVRIFSLADPVNPVQVGSYAPAYRIHDFHGAGNVGYACAIDNGMVDVLDITNPATLTRIASFATPQRNPHSSWTTEDGRYLLVAHEDLLFGPTGHPAVFDVLNPSQAQLVYEFRDLPGAVSHIPTMRGTTAAISYYTAGVRLWDLSVPTQPVEFGYYDTWGGDDFILAGCYQAAAYLPSGIVLAADMTTGLYVIQPSQNYGIIRGIVRSSSNGMKPVADATVRVLPSGPATITGPDGLFALAPTAGTVTVQVEKYGYGTQSATPVVTTGSDQQLNFAISSLPTGSVKGTVRGISGSALAGADVSIPSSPFAAVTGSKGSYSFGKVATGSIQVRAEYVGLIPVSTPLSLASGQHATVDFNLAAAPFYDDAEMDRGWTLGAPGDDATQGIWVRAVPIATFNGSVPAQPGADHTPGAGTTCFVTGNTNNAFTSSVNGGKTTLICPTLDLSGVTDPRIVFWRYYYHNHLIGGDLALSQPFLTEISNDGGASWTTVSQTQRSIGAWERIEIRVTDFFAAPGSVRVRFVAQNRVGGITEALIDDFEYYSGAGSAALALPPRAASVVTAPNIALRTLGSAGAFQLSVGRETNLTARIVDVQGRSVATIYKGAVSPGIRELRWDGRTATGIAGSGVYFFRVDSEGNSRARKFLWIR